MIEPLVTKTDLLRGAPVPVQSAAALFKGLQYFNTCEAALGMGYRYFLSVIFLLLSKAKLENYRNF